MTSQQEVPSTESAAATAVTTRSAGPKDEAAETSTGEGRLARLWRAPWLVPAVLVGLVMAVPFRGLWVAPGPPMEEGFMLVFPERVLAGDVPNRDFLHLYGPGSLWVLAGFFKVFGVDLWVERLVGFLQILGLVAGTTVVGYRWGRYTAVLAGLITAIMIMPPIQFTALAWVGGLALALWAVIVAVRVFDASSAAEPADGTASVGTASDAAGAGADDHPREASVRHRRTLLYAGLLGGAALLYRPDLVLALGLPLGAMWIWGFDRGQRRQLLIGLLAGVSPYLLHLVMAGPGNAVTGIVLDPVFELRDGRRLPFPPSTERLDGFLNRAFIWRDWSWPFPALSEPKQLFVWVFVLFAVCAGLLAVAIVARRAGSPEGWRLLALSLLCIGILPQAVQRADTTHMDWVSCVPFALVPGAVSEWIRLRGGSFRIRAVAALAPLALMVAVIPHYTVRWYADYVGQTFGYRQDGNPITNRGRTFYYGNAEVSVAARRVIADVEGVAEPGDRLIVGTGDLRRTAYSEAYLYFLLPQLEPGTQYVEMDPGIANAEDSGLDDELRAADVVILSTVYDDWVEPNTSADAGSDAPNQVLRDEYCLHDTYGTLTGSDPLRPIYELYLKC
ncbi:MAG: hypothetical protein ACRD2C_20460 [Acidimicrobiales bacterium]